MSPEQQAIQQAIINKLQKQIEQEQLEVSAMIDTLGLKKNHILQIEQQIKWVKAQGQPVQDSV